MTMSGLPSHAPLDSVTLENFARLIGEHAAIRLSVVFGGRTLYIPLNPPPGSLLVQTIGIEAATQLAKQYGGVRFVVPLERGKRERIITLRFRQGRTVQEIATLVGCTERHVYNVQREYLERGGQTDLGETAADDTDQGDLFTNFDQNTEH